MSGLVQARSSPRIAALAVDGGKGCLFRSIVDLEGRPSAEIAVLHMLDHDRVWSEPTTVAAHAEADIAPIAAAFRDRAVREFLGAPGIPTTVTLYLPWYCALASVEAIAPSMGTLLGRASLSQSRLVAELLVPDPESPPTQFELLLKRVAWLRGMGLGIALRLSERLAIDEPAVLSAQPDWVHVPRVPIGFEETASIRALLDGVSSQLEAARVVIGGVDSPEQAALAEALGASFLSGDAVAPARFLC